jgi:hypothetical protein
MSRSRRPRQVIDSDDEEEVDEDGEYSGGEDLNAEFVSSINSWRRERADMVEHRSRGSCYVGYIGIGSRGWIWRIEDIGGYHL